MRKTAVYMLLVLALAFTVFGASMAVLGSSTHSRNVVTVTINGNSKAYTNQDAAVPIQWGSVNFGENNQTVTITNQGNTNLKPQLTITSPNLPSGWTLKFSLDNQPIGAGQSATGTLTLNVPASTPQGDYSWCASINLRNSG